MSVHLVHHASCLSCPWTDDGPKADRAAERHTREQHHATTVRSFPDTRVDVPVMRPRSLWLRADDARAALEGHGPVYAPEAGGDIVCDCGVDDALDYRDHVIGVLTAATITPRTSSRHTAAERQLDTERDAR